MKGWRQWKTTESLEVSTGWLSSVRQSISSNTQPRSGRGCLVSLKPFFGRQSWCTSCWSILNYKTFSHSQVHAGPYKWWKVNSNVTSLVHSSCTKIEGFSQIYSGSPLRVVDPRDGLGNEKGKRTSWHHLYDRRLWRSDRLTSLTSLLLDEASALPCSFHRNMEAKGPPGKGSDWFCGRRPIGKRNRFLFRRREGKGTYIFVRLLRLHLSSFFSRSITSVDIEIQECITGWCMNGEKSRPFIFQKLQCIFDNSLLDSKKWKYWPIQGIGCFVTRWYSAIYFYGIIFAY